MSIVSRAMRVRRSSGRYCSVRMLCSRSASFTRITRTSSTMASSSLRKFSACRSSEEENGILLILVTPSTMWSTSSPKYSLMRSGSVSVSSSTSCSRPTATQAGSIRMSARMAATSSGCTR